MKAEIVGGLIGVAIMLAGIGMAVGIWIGTKPHSAPPATPPALPALQEFDYHLRDGRIMPCLQTPTALDCDWWDAKPLPPPMMPIPLPEPAG